MIASPWIAQQARQRPCKRTEPQEALNTTKLRISLHYQIFTKITF